MPARQGSVVIENVQPQVDCGRYAVKRAAGETVRVTAVGQGWSVQTEGKAVGPGIEGQNVNVRTEAGRLLSARPSGDRQVEVTL